MNRIKELRKEFGLTQQELADKLGCSKSIIGLYENELRKPSMEILLKLVIKKSVDITIYAICMPFSMYLVIRMILV